MPVSCQRERRRREHNDMEKKRKEQIKACICKMGELLPPNYITSERHSTLEIVEKSLAYMRELKEARTKFSGTEEVLQKEIIALKSERDKFSDIIKAAGLSTESIPTNGVSSTTDVKDESPKPKNKTKKRNTLNAHLQQLQEQREKQQQQEMISSSVSVSDDTCGNIQQNQLMNMPGGAFINGQNVMFNPMMNQFMMPGMMGNGNQIMPNIGPMGVIGAGSGASGMPPGANNSATNQTGQNSNLQNDQNASNMNKSSDDMDAGLLQLAMQDAGITPGSNSGPQSSSALTPSVSESGPEAESSSAENNALQTLASVATSDHVFSTENDVTDNQSATAAGSMTGNSSNLPMMTSSQSGLQPLLQTGNNAMINMPMLGNPTGLPGQQQQQQQMQQIMFINDQGIPMIANVPVGMDPNNPNIFPNAQKPGLMQNINQSSIIKDQSGNIDQNALALAQQQANMAALQNQLLGQNAGGNIPSMPFQQQNLLQGNIIQTPNGQLLQQIGPQINGQGQLIGMPGQGQGLVVAGQQGQLALNTMPSQPNQLPSALILPNGQIIPVVTNPGNIVSQPGLTLSQGQLTQPRMSGPQIQTAVDGQILSGPNSQGLLIPAASIGQVVSSSTAASLSTSVVPTSAIHSVMTTQIQGSTVQTQKPISSSMIGSMPSSSQPKIVSIPPGAPNLGSGGIAASGKASGTPILISLPINGQPTTVLLDPVTMQVLGTVQPGQPPVSQQGTVPVPTTATGQLPVAAQTGATANKNKNKNNANQRAICPKPLGNDGFRNQSAPAKKKKPSSKASNKSKETVPADSLSETLQIQIPESTTDPEVSSAVSSESTDILAKAAESIFSPPVGDVAGVGGGFYNPANEDNPLHIDTSAAEVDDDLKSPNKHSKKLSSGSTTNSGTLEDNVLGLNSVAEGAKSINVSKVVNNSAGKSEVSSADNVTSLSVTLEEIAGIQFSESVTKQSDKSNDVIVVSETHKENKKSKHGNTSKTNEIKKDPDSKLGSKGSSTKSKSSKKAASEKSSVLDLEKVDSDSQMDIESTLIHIPDNITFGENDLSDVLDQVEQLGSSVSENVAKTSKKSKTKRTKPADPESEPSSKKRKSGKDSKESSKGNTPAKEILSMPSSLSVYDFDDSDDIVPSILPLNGKDFTTLSSTPTKTDFGVTEEDVQKSEQKSKNSAQNKTKKTSKSAKNSKDSESTTNKVVSDDHSSAPLFEMKDITDTSRKTYQETNKENKSDTNNQTKTSTLLPSMPEIDTTTSLFGFPVPKKLQRPDTALRAQTNQKPASQPSPKDSPQQNTSLMSPKQTVVSPKPGPGMVSPLQNSVSLELVSPKLSIVSPTQGVLMESDNITSSPKHYTEMSPIKKRTPTEKLENMKVSSFSALNSVPLSNSSKDSIAPMDTSKPLVSSVNSQSAGVITSAKTANVSVADSKKQNSEPKVPNESNLALKKNVPETIQNMSNSTSSNSGQKLQNSTKSAPTNMENKFSSANVSSANANSLSISAQRPSQTVNSSQNNRYGNQFNNEPVYGSLPGMNNRSKDNSAHSNTGMNNFSVPYSADSVFNPHAEKVIKSPPNVNISTLNQKPDTSNMSKLRNTNNPYSVDNFVQSSRDEGIRSRPDTIGAHSDLISSSALGNPPSDFSRLQSESSPDGFNFANIGLNLQPITSNIPSSFMDTSSTVTSNVPSSFSFSLSSTSSTVTTSSGGLGHHQFPFFPPVLSSSSNVPSSQTSLPASMPNMDMFDQNNSASNNVIQRNNTVMHPSGSNMPRGDNSHISRVDSNSVPRGESMQRNDKAPQSVRSDDSNRDQGNNPSCSKQKIPKGQGPATIQEPFSSFPNSSGGPENNFFHDSQMKSNVGKSPTEQMRKATPQDKMMEMNSSHSRSSSAQSTMSDKRGGAMDRSPQMMNSTQSYYQPNYPSSKSLNTPPLHHPVMMPPDDRARNMTNRSPYDTPFPPPPSSQGFNTMGPTGYPGRFDSGPPSFSRDNSGTQPLSHTPVNSGGRKSANPPPPAQTSVVKPPQKQSAPPLVPMGGPSQAPPSQAPRPTPPNHRATTPHGNQGGPTPTPSAVSQSRQSKQPSRNSKPLSSSKKSKPLPFMEVDSNLSNSIFETNRSMTPFFPTMQNLSPQSRMQHEGSPFLPGNFFGPGPRFPNSNTPVPKNSDIGAPFNTLFPARAPQNGLGLNFQPGFGMNMNPLHGNHGNAPQLTPHTAPHMANFNLNNIFSDAASQNESSLNISPIKFPHANYQGMDHNAMQHHHQYNRGHPSVMSINSILGPNHHGFDGRMNTSMAGPFHSHGHPSFIPPLNFSMHDH